MGDVLPFHFQVVAALIFAIGALGVLLRRNMIEMFMSIELMLNAANLGIAQNHHVADGMNGKKHKQHWRAECQNVHRDV